MAELINRPDFDRPPLPEDFLTAAAECRIGVLQRCRIRLGAVRRRRRHHRRYALR
jgi:hypothetical protein